MDRMRWMGRAVTVLALMGATAAWGLEPSSDSPTLSGGWQRVDAATAVGGTCFAVKNRMGTTQETAVWNLQAPAGGDYQIQIYTPPVDGPGPRTRNATYVINRGHGLLVRGGVDQNLPGWQTIGRFTLAAGPISVTLIDRTQEPAGSHYVVADAIRLLQAGAQPSFNAAPVPADLNRSAVAGDVVTFDLRFSNTGQRTWYKDPAPSGQTPVRLLLLQGPAPVCAGIQSWDPGYGWLPRARDRVLLDTAQVAAGQTGSFLFSIQLAQNLPAGVYTYRFRPVAEPTGSGDGGVIGPEVTVNISVTPRPQSELDFSNRQLYRANLSVHTANSDGDKLIDRFLPTDRSPAGALAYAKSRETINVLGLTDHGEELSAAEWAGQADAVAAGSTLAAGGPLFMGLRAFKWSKTTGPHDSFGFPWEGSPDDDGHLSIFGTSTWTGTRAALDGAPPQLTPFFFGPATPGATLTGAPSTLADWLWVNGYPRPNAVDNGAAPGQFAAPALFFRSSFFREFLYQPDMDRFFPLLAVGTGETHVTSDYVRVPNLPAQISDKGGYRFEGPDTPTDVTNRPPAELLTLMPDVLAALGHPEDMSKWGTNPNNRNRYWLETALRKGWHVAPTLNGDNHAGCYCDDQGYTGIWAKSVAGMSYAQAQATILQALRERAVFASENRGLSAQFSVFSNGAQYRMGQRNVPLTNAPRFRLDLTSVAVSGFPADVSVAQAFIVGSDGNVTIGENLTGPTARIEMTLPVDIGGPARERFFYALVVQKDGQRLLTAPIWMSPCCPTPSCQLFALQSKGTGDTCTTLSFTSQNATSATLSIDGGPLFTVPVNGTRPVLRTELNTGIRVHTAVFRAINGCGTAACSADFSCETISPTPTCQISVSPKGGDCSTPFTVTWSSTGLVSTRLLLDGVDLGAVPASGSRTLPGLSPGTHTVRLIGTPVDKTTGPASDCQATFVVTGTGDQPLCRMSVMPSAGGPDALFDICFFASNTSRVDVFVDGVLKCTQLNPIAGVQYNCKFLGSTVGSGMHTASIIATGCGGTCQRALPFLVFMTMPAPK